MTRTDTPGTTAKRPTAATVVGVLAVLGTVGSVVMVVAHVQLGLPVIAAMFAVGTVLFAAVAVGAFRMAPWAWPAALVVNGIGFVSSVFPWRGLENSGAPALVTLIALGVLLSRPGRDALLYRRS